MLDVYSLFREGELLNYEKTEFALAILVREKSPPAELLQHIFDNYLCITKPSKNGGLRTSDFIQDGIYIYSSFMHDYGIDLFEERDRLHWWQFVSLFQGLSDSTKMREVISIRTREIPALTKNNGRYIANLVELKQYYALDISQEEREQNFRSGLEKLAQALKARAVS